MFLQFCKERQTYSITIQEHKFTKGKMIFIDQEEGNFPNNESNFALRESALF
jgi:hypothetical protein